MKIPVWIDSAIGSKSPGAYVTPQNWPAGAYRWDRANLPADTSTAGLQALAKQALSPLTSEYTGMAAQAGYHVAAGGPRFEIGYELLTADTDEAAFEKNAVELLRILSTLKVAMGNVGLSVDGVPVGWYGRSDNPQLPGLLDRANQFLVSIGVTRLMVAATPMLYFHHQQPTPAAFFDMTTALEIDSAQALALPVVPYVSLHFEDGPEENLPDDALVHQAEYIAKAYARGQIDGVKLFLGWDDTKGPVPQTPADQHALQLTGNAWGYNW